MNRFDPDLRCLYCNNLMYLNDIDTQDDPITNESICLCNNCGEIMLFNDSLILRRPTPEELVKILNNPEYQFINDYQKVILIESGKKNRCQKW